MDVTKLFQYTTQSSSADEAVMILYDLTQRGKPHPAQTWKGLIDR